MSSPATTSSRTSAARPSSPRCRPTPRPPARPAATPASSRQAARQRRLIALGAELTDIGWTEPDPAAALIQAQRLVDRHLAPVDTASDTLRALEWPALWNDDTTPQAEWLAEPLIPTGRQIAIYSTAKAGKSLVTLELAAARATGRPVLDQPEGPPLVIVYLDFEQARADVRDRLVDMGYGPDDDLSRLLYYLAPDIAPLDTQEGGEALMAIVARHHADLVIVDTVARAVCGEENSADTLRNFATYTGRRLRAAGITLLRLDHAGKSVERGQRGTSAKADDVDVVWRLSINGRQLELRRTHSRVPWIPEVVRLQRIEEPLLTHTVKPVDSWPEGTLDTAAALDRLDVPLDATVKTAGTTLRAR